MTTTPSVIRWQDINVHDILRITSEDTRTVKRIDFHEHVTPSECVIHVLVLFDDGKRMISEANSPVLREGVRPHA